MKKTTIQNKVLFPEILWERPVHFYKKQAGKVLVLSGSTGMTGAAILTCEAVFRSGTGMLVLGFPDKLKEIYKEILPEAMTLPLSSTYGGSLAKKAKGAILEESKSCDVVIIGPGLSRNSETIHLIWELIFEIEKPMVLDADGLYALATGISVIRKNDTEKFLTDYMKKIKVPVILTPHPGEMERILSAATFKEYKNKKIKADFIEKHKEVVARIVSEGLGCFVVLKGHNTVIADPDGNLIVNKIGGLELATAGAGDVLSGIIGSFVAQNPNKILESVSTAVFLHGLAGKMAKEKLSDRSVIASDIIKYLPEAIKTAEKM